MRNFVTLLLALLCTPALLRAAASSPSDEVVFTRDIAPILVQKCQGCHGPQKQKGGYRLDTFDRLTRPGDNEAAPSTPGRPEASELFRLITHPDPKKRTPQKDDPLPANQLALNENRLRQRRST